MIFLQILAFLFGFGLVAWTVYSAVVTLILPRSAPDLITRLVFISVRRLFNLRLKHLKTYRERDRLMAFFAPVGLISLVPVWLFLVMVGFTFMVWSLGQTGVYISFRISGSSLLTLGFADRPDSLAITLLEFLEAALGMMLVALVIAYLPTVYSAFSRRETLVTLLDVRAGLPPSAVEMLVRYHRIHGLEQLKDEWQTWETWFADIEESHTSLPALVFFRSPLPERSWVTASGAVMDTAALSLAAVDIPANAPAALCIRAGYLALRRIADFFNLPYNPNPKFPDQAISITRQEFDQVLVEMESQGVPLKPDRDQAWLDFAGWRVNYDQVLIALANLTMAPASMWTGKRGMETPIPLFEFKQG
jgi:hypothetical protein